MARTSRSFGPSADTFWLWFGGIWLAVGLPFLLIGLSVTVSEQLRHRRLDAHGRVTEGRVLTKTLSGTSDPVHLVGYRFTLPDGSTVRDEAQVDGATWDRLVELRSLRVTYLPGRPRTHRIEGEVRDWVFGAIFSGLGGIFTLLGGFVFLRGLSLRRRTARAP